MDYPQGIHLGEWYFGEDLDKQWYAIYQIDNASSNIDKNLFVCQSFHQLVVPPFESLLEAVYLGVVPDRSEGMVYPMSYVVSEG
eukprot:7157555-Ditylum_brightwellii.AAC.1